MESRLILGPRIAEGGMAEVFSARLLGTEGFAKDVVVKRVLPQLARDPDFISRFLDEARLAAQLSHPGIVQVIQLVAEGDELMMVMEAVDGADLATVLKLLRADSRTLSLPLALRVASAVAGALAHAHEKRDRHNQPLGIIHRDVTPSNILVSRDGATKLIDFGIARASSVARLTRRGAIIGKIHYMAPEQVRDLALDARVDVWAAGVVLYQMLTGRRPFTGDSDTEIFRRIALGERSDVRALAEVPESLARVVDACLAPARDARVASARALALLLDDVIASEGLYASAAELGGLVDALVPAPLERAPTRADGHSRTASAEHSSILPADTQADTTPARKQRASSPTLTLDSAETTCVFDVDTLTRLNTGDAQALTQLRDAIDERDTETLKQLPQRPPQARPSRRPARAASLAAAGVLFAAVGALGAWGALAGADAPPASAAVIAPVAAVVRAPAAPVPVPVASALPRAPVPSEAQIAVLVQQPERPPVARARASEARPKKAARIAAEPGTLVIDSRPWSAVRIDGVDVGITPIAPRDLAPGVHTLLLENAPQGLSRTITVVVKSGRTTTTRVDLRRP